MKVLALVCVMMIWLAAGSLPVVASLSSHPIIMYEKGDVLLGQCYGSPEAIDEVQAVFVDLIQKYPHSPFGYLGMSRLYRLEAWRSEYQDYDLEVIRKGALPYALKALELGPSIKAVHENYDFFEQFFRSSPFSSQEEKNDSSVYYHQDGESLQTQN